MQEFIFGTIFGVILGIVFMLIKIYMAYLSKRDDGTFIK